MEDSKKTNDLTFLASLCLYLAAVEYAIPKPLPFMRLGLANLPILLSLELLSAPGVFLLVALKIILQAFISGTLFSYIFVFSTAGSVAAALGMQAVYQADKIFQKKFKKNLTSFTGISITGAFFNNIAQITCSRFILFGENTKYIAPVLLLTGLATGTALGLFCSAFAEKSRWYKMRLQNKGYFPLQKEERLPSLTKRRDAFALTKFVVCLVSLVIFFQIKDLKLLWGTVAFFFIADEILKKGRVKLLPSFVIVLSVTIFSLLSPFGKVLFSINNWKITEDALKAGLFKSGILLGMVFISQCSVDKNLHIPGKLGKFIAEVFKYFDKLSSFQTFQKLKFQKGNFINSIDLLLCRIYNGEQNEL